MAGTATPSSRAVWVVQEPVPFCPAASTMTSTKAAPVAGSTRSRTSVRRAQDIELIGGGGTDQREGIGAALALRPRPDLILVLTDGQTPWPDRRPPVPVVIALVEPKIGRAHV